MKRIVAIGILFLLMSGIIVQIPEIFTLWQEKRGFCSICCIFNVGLQYH